MLDAAAHEELERVLHRARDRGFLGPGPVALHIEHALRLADVVGAAPEWFVDLGSGAGVPGLVLALRWPGSHGVLVDAGARRGAHLEEATRTLGIADRTVVRVGRAEVLAREAELRGRADLVVARSFGRPSVTAECAVGFLRTGGALMVSEPPAVSLGERWPAGDLRDLGFGPATGIEAGDAHFAKAVLEAIPDDRWPRRTGIPAKRPLW